ncbi:MAG: hypothetical protein AB8E87_03965, partial [Prochlorococcus sp.]
DETAQPSLEAAQAEASASESIDQEACEEVAGDSEELQAAQEQEADAQAPPAAHLEPNPEAEPESAQKQNKQPSAESESEPTRVSDTEHARGQEPAAASKTPPQDKTATAAKDLLKGSLLRIKMPSHDDLPKANHDDLPKENHDKKIIETTRPPVKKSPEVLRKDTANNSQLEVLRAVQDGWDGFRKAPWTFVLFTLLVGALSMIFQGVNTLMPSDGNTINITTIIILILAVLANGIVNLWGITGMIRGAWIALNGNRPTFADFIRWDGNAYLRLFVRQFVLGLVLFLLIIIGGLVAGGLAAVNQILMLVPMIMIIIFATILTINQIFLPWIALLEKLGPLETIQRGWSVVNPSWGMVLLLALVEILILMIGVLLCFVGLLAAAPVAVCISTAAYRQLFGSDDQTGLLSSN